MVDLNSAKRHWTTRQAPVGLEEAGSEGALDGRNYQKACRQAKEAARDAKTSRRQRMQ